MLLSKSAQSFHISALLFEKNEELNRFADQYDNVLLFGDFNSRTKLLQDYAEPDMTILHENGLDEVFDEFQEEI